MFMSLYVNLHLMLARYYYTTDNRLSGLSDLVVTNKASRVIVKSFINQLL